MTAAKKTTKYSPGAVSRLLERLGVEGVVKLEATPADELRELAGVKRKPARRRKAGAGRPRRTAPPRRSVEELAAQAIEEGGA